MVLPWLLQPILKVINNKGYYLNDFAKDLVTLKINKYSKFLSNIKLTLMK